MELKTLVRDMAAIDDGRWVAADEVPGLGDIRLKVRGASSDAVQGEISRHERAGMDRLDAVARVAAEMCLIEIDGLTNDGEAVSADQVRDRLTEPAFSPLVGLIFQAVAAVDNSRESKAVALAKN